MKNKRDEAPEVLLKYEKFWKDTFGEELNNEKYNELVGLSQELAKTDEKFKAILSEKLVGEFIDSENGLEDKNKRKWAMITALSTYGKEFGLQVD